MSQIQVRINGRGNAWPVIVGQDHPFYDRRNYEDMANASCSIIKSSKSNPKAEDLDWELMVDAGHGAVQYLLKYCNRIPEALFITHPHIDHTLGIDWIIHSYYKLYKKPYPVYATVLCWEKTKHTYPHLESMVDFNELIPYQTIDVKEVSGVKVQPFPAYHGRSANGATMLHFITVNDSVKNRILITGDILCPLLREQDYEAISGVNIMVADANNRYPYPNSNHWSILKGVDESTSGILQEYINKISVKTLLYPHLLDKTKVNYWKSFDYILENNIQLSDFHFTISSFAERISPQKTVLMHYSGSEDEKYYKQKRLSENEFESWLCSTVVGLSINTKFLLPYVNQHIKI